MSEVNAVDHQSMQHMLSDGAVHWEGFGDQLAQEANVLLGKVDHCQVGVFAARP